ncbi:MULTISPECIES: hypothetical protein [Caulobacter]|jgi:hypothetical protein|uniref:Uncharacterized protein n=1 Tax=Caulobacter vibrioides OR37 TaxID=1292034 RepID=R0CW88_CAUVI|nr:MULTISPECIES: hypothetical protein [Caulobacter]ENZ80600.1 hypothetical protein OR37_03512 [Caulobacter vibrioides OR37]MBQ1561565.1 hypothetical protein [Caulobacter sp.]
MDAALKLQTFARRTCMERFDHWADIYSLMVRGDRDRDGPDYTDEAYAVFPRYNVAQTVLDHIETLDADALPDCEQLRTLLVHLARNATSDRTRPMANPIQQRAMADEREVLASLFMSVTASELAQVKPLFYRRVLDARAVHQWREAIAATWGAPDGYWYPLSEKTHASLVALELDRVDDVQLQARIKKFFSANAVRRVIELREYDESYELDGAAAVLSYTGAEGFWTAPGNEWIVYCSHEGTITLGGAIAREIGPEYQVTQYDPSRSPHWLADSH